MRLGMNVHAFTGDNGLQILNRSANEIVFTAIGSEGTLFKPVVRARVLAPVARDLVVQAVVTDGEAFHASVARYDDEPAFRAGAYLCAIVPVAFHGTDEFTGSALATVRLDEDLAAVPRPVPPIESEAAF